MDYLHDQRVVLILDAGGTNFVFSAIQGGKEIVEPARLPSEANNLEKSLVNMIQGFEQVQQQLSETPSAISFAFPGPADYPNGIINNLVNLPAYAGGVPLGSILENHFKIPVTINNDGDLFAYGEAIAGLLPKVNKMLKDAGCPKQYKNLFGVTLGTGFGGGIVRDGDLFMGDNSCSAEIWITRNKVRHECFAEEGASIRAVQGSYANRAGLESCDLSPKDIFDIATGNRTGDREAAKAAFNELGEVVGDALANAIALIDGLIVIGGGLSGAHEQFLPAIVAEMNGSIASYAGDQLPRIIQKVFNLEDEDSIDEFLKGETKEITVPGTEKKIMFDAMVRTGIGVSVLGTSEAIAIGAYAYALHELDKGSL
jgi:glucokinase